MKDINIRNKTFRNVAKFKYLRTNLKTRSCIHEEINSRN